MKKEILSAGICDTCSIPKMISVGNGFDEPPEEVFHCEPTDREITPEAPGDRLTECKFHKKIMKEENLYTPNCIRTFGGRYIDVFNMDTKDIEITDIAHALAHIPRFGGHLPRFFSVAQHCVNCAGITKGDKLEALLHDASEAYILDMPKPIKDRLPDYKELENKVMSKIFRKFELRLPLSKEVKKADKVCLEFEWYFIMLKGGESYNCYSPEKAKEIFMETFNKIIEK